jgi:hypothetical protein
MVASTYMSQHCTALHGDMGSHLLSTWAVASLSIVMILSPKAGRAQSQPYYINVSQEAAGDSPDMYDASSPGYQELFSYTDSMSVGGSTNVVCGIADVSNSASAQSQLTGTLGNWSGFCTAATGSSATTNQFSCSGNGARGSFSLSWQDTITPSSTTLPMGSQVAMRVTMLVQFNELLTASDSGAGENYADVQANVVANGATLGLFTYGTEPFTPPSSYIPTVATNITINVGTAFSVSGVLNDDCMVDVGFPFTSANASVSTSQRVYLDSLTPGVSLIATSGVSYATPAPSNLTPSATTQGFNLTFSTISNDLYDVQTTTNLVVGVWATLATNIVGNGSITNYIDMSTSVRQKFYRVYVHF